MMKDFSAFFNFRKTFLPCLRLLPLFFILIFSHSTFAQNIVRGKILDARTSEGMPFANVYIANSTKGTQTDQNGNFQLSNVPLGNIQLLVSYVGYQNYGQTIKVDENSQLELTIRIKANENTFTEIEVKSKRDKSWERKLKDFKRIFLGQNYDANKCKIINEWVFDFKDIEGGFSASALAPIEFENRSLGYRVYYDLREFVQQRGSTFYFGFPRFEELTPADKKEYNRWMQNRNEAYLRSPERFYRSVYRQSLEQDGYIVFEMDSQTEWYSSAKKFHKALNIIDDKNVSKRLIIQDQRNKILKLSKPLEIINGKISTTSDARIRSMDGRITEILEDGWVNNPRAIEMGGFWALQGVSELLPREFATEIEKGSVLSETRKSDFNKVYLHINKPGYVTGENIWFSAYVFDSDKKISRKHMPLYVQLHDDAGNWVAEQIIFSSNGRGVGYLHLPDSLKSGVYRLRAYNREMLNYPTTIFDKQLVIQNPKDDFRVLSNLRKLNESEIGKLTLEVETNKETYQPNETVTLKLKLKNNFGEPVMASMSASVINPKFLVSDLEEFNIDSYVANTLQKPETIGSFFAYEPNISVTGKTFDLNTQKSIPNAKIIFMFTGADATTSRFIEADKDGKFRITDLDFIGKNMLVYQVNSKKNEPLEHAVVLIDKFPVAMQIANTVSQKAEMSEETRKDFEWQQKFPDGISNIKNTEVFVAESNGKEDQIDSDAGVTKIYGEPDYYVNFDKQMNFTNVYEMLQGNLPGVKVEKTRNFYKVFVRGIGSWNTGQLDPLFLVDGVEMTDLSSINPNDIIRIELLSGGKAAIFGMKGSNGVIAFYTKRFAEKKAGLQFTKNETINGYQKEIEFQQLDFEKVGLALVEDKRSAVYWNPEIILDSKGQGQFSFKASGVSARLKVVIEGVTLFGFTVRKEFEVQVSDK
ncbi:hypothetical protein EGI26_17015 [Lacihabitans sp. CCS-44]|uniref:carboxypeptidase-like regulatory domain-containing protein n=1 Tax=Lacihabitans sp. CCS-44 TaxID=2487331 RepID=UPI0020CC6FBA|nr:carboxypeptidase-like regulatory domain-containing protein [Lacihabitans sp. CCS-44]MCP9756868.1 hypothetical protein [Lacihabitans sp. CCS-44]